MGPPLVIYNNEMEDYVSILSGSDGNDETEDQLQTPPSPPTSPDEDDVIVIPSVSEPTDNSPEAQRMPDSSFTPHQPPSPSSSDAYEESSDGYEESSLISSYLSWYTWRDGPLPLPSCTLLPDSHYAVIVDMGPPLVIYNNEMEDDVSILSGSDGNDETEDQLQTPPSPPTSPDEDDVTPWSRKQRRLKWSIRI
jgi:hypothetical protein